MSANSLGLSRLQGMQMNEPTKDAYKMLDELVEHLMETTDKLQLARDVTFFITTILVMGRPNIPDRARLESLKRLVGFAKELADQRGIVIKGFDA